MARRKKPLSGDKRYRIYVFNTKGKFAKLHSGSNQRIMIKDTKTRERFDLGFAKTDSKKVRNIGKIIDTAISNLRDKIWNKLLGRKPEVSKPPKKKLKEIKPKKIKKLERFRDKKENLQTFSLTFDEQIDIMQSHELGENGGAKQMLLVWFYLAQTKTDTIPLSVSSGDIAIPANDQLLDKIHAKMKMDEAGLFDFIGTSYPTLIFEQSILKISK